MFILQLNIRNYRELQYFVSSHSLNLYHFFFAFFTRSVAFCLPAASSASHLRLCVSYEKLRKKTSESKNSEKNGAVHWRHAHRLKTTCIYVKLHHYINI